MNGAPSRQALERNVRLYPLYQGLLNAYFWLPVFFLYFSQRLPLGQVLRLEAIYYATVVLLEVPSGYFSDRIGRRVTLLVSSSGLVVSYALFFVGRSFEMLAAAQVLLALGLAFNSGTDTALHFDSLSALGRDDEYAAREARANQVALGGRALAALIGGVVAAWQLRFAYGLSVLAAVGTLSVAVLFVEPGLRGPGAAATVGGGFVRHLGACLGRLGNRTMAWLFAFAVLMTVINHVPYEFYQPYIGLLLDRRGIDLPVERTPLFTGVVTAFSMMIAAWATGHSIGLRDRVGLGGALLLTTLLQVVIMTVMGLLLHEVVLGLILLRSVPAAVMQPPLRAAITPRLPQRLRATYLSLQSLTGRLAFSGVLLLMSLGSRLESAPDWPAISSVSLTGAALGAAGLALLAVTARRCLGNEARRDPP